MFRSARVFASSLLVSASLIACDARPPGAEMAEPGPVQRPPATPASMEGPTDYERALERLDQQVAAHERSVERYDNDWSRVERLAEAYATRAKLTGDYEDYLAADRAVARAYEMAAEGAGPHVVSAHLDYSLHRLERASNTLDEIEAGALTTPSTLFLVSVIRADIAFHRADLETAEEAHRFQEEVRPSTASAFRLAYDHWQSGRFDEAEQWLATAAARVPDSDPRLGAWVDIQRGLIDLDRGRCMDALVHYREADARFSGWWLVEEHIAEVLACIGEFDAAERLYRDVVERTDSPELIDALADLLEERGEVDASAEFRARATARFEEQLTQLPEASYGHALSHFLAHGTAERALELAEANHALRPGAEAQMQLAQALLRSGRLAEADTRISAVLDTPFRSAEIHATAAVIYRARGWVAEADEQEALARAIDPGIMDDVEGLAP